MINRKNSDAFMAVLETGSFEAAAEKLCLSASAVSLRIQSLEYELGESLILRERPCKATETGQLLFEHLQELQLEQEKFRQRLNDHAQGSSDFNHVKIGCNADSLETWVLSSLAECLIEQHIVLKLIIQDQNDTHHLFKTGQVNACISTKIKPMKGCESHLLGTMRYRLVATAAFRARWFSDGLDRVSLTLAPAVIFNPQDQLHSTLLKRYFGLRPEHYPHHFIPSSSAFVQCIQLGLGYGLVPEIQMKQQLRDGVLVELADELAVDVDLYWHIWENQSGIMQQLSDHILEHAQQHMQLN